MYPVSIFGEEWEIWSSAFKGDFNIDVKWYYNTLNVTYLLLYLMIVDILKTARRLLAKFWVGRLKMRRHPRIHANRRWRLKLPRRKLTYQRWRRQAILCAEEGCKAVWISNQAVLIHWSRLWRGLISVIKIASSKLITGRLSVIVANVASSTLSWAGCTMWTSSEESRPANRVPSVPARSAGLASLQVLDQRCLGLAQRSEGCIWLHLQRGHTFRLPKHWQWHWSLRWKSWLLRKVCPVVHSSPRALPQVQINHWT